MARLDMLDHRFRNHSQPGCDIDGARGLRYGAGQEFSLLGNRYDADTLHGCIVGNASFNTIEGVADLVSWLVLVSLLWSI